MIHGMLVPGTGHCPGLGQARKAFSPYLGWVMHQCPYPSCLVLYNSLATAMQQEYPCCLIPRHASLYVPLINSWWNAGNCQHLSLVSWSPKTSPTVMNFEFQNSKCSFCNDLKEITRFSQTTSQMCPKAHTAYHTLWYMHQLTGSSHPPRDTYSVYFGNLKTAAQKLK